MTRYLVTGATGLVGSHFIRHMLNLKQHAPKIYGDIEIFGVGLNSGTSKVPKGIFYRSLDLSDSRKTASAILDIGPDHILHFVGSPYSDDWDVLIQANIKTTASILEAVHSGSDSSRSKTRVVVVGSAAEYGAVSVSDLPIRETQIPKPVSRYAMSMLSRSVLVQGYANLGIQAMVGRLFNPLASDMTDRFAAGSFARQIKAIVAGVEKPPIKVGNLDPKRDFIDLEDASAAFLAIAEKGHSGQIYNICSGHSHSMGEMLKSMMAAKGVKIPYISDPSRIKANEVLNVVGSLQKISKDTGWKPRISFEESIRRIVADG